MSEVWQGTLRKLRVTPGSAMGDPARYALADGYWQLAERAADQPLNGYLGMPLHIEFTGRIACTYCGRASRKTFGEGFCYPCFRARAEADICIVKPELCHYHNPEDPCRDNAFAHRHCFRPHVLYAALTSAPKVGLTRCANIPTRWLDQGATEAVPLAELSSRRAAGLVEARLRDDHGLADRTHWTSLLRRPRGDGDIRAFADEVLALLEAQGVAPLPAEQREVCRYTYPVMSYPEKVKSLSLDRAPLIEGLLQGIKGQYLILDTGVMNLRKHTGYGAVVTLGG